MAKFLKKYFSIKENEISKVTLSLLLILFSAIALIITRSVRDSIFLLSPAIKYLPFMYIGLAIFTVIVAYFYSLIADNYPRDKIIIILYSIYAISFFILYYFSLTGGLIFSIFFYIYSEIVVILLLLKAWTFISDLYNAREAKRLFGFISIGSIVSGIIAGLIIQIYSKLFSVNSLIIVAAISIIISIFITNLLSKKAFYNFQLKKKKIQPLHISYIFRDKYLKTIASIFIFMAISTSLSDYIFKIGAKIHFSSYDNPSKSLTSFFGFYYCISNIITLVYSIFLSNKAIAKLGLKNSLSIFPAHLFLSSIVFIFYPVLFSISLIFFGITGIKYTINQVALHISFLPLQNSIRGRLKAFMSGIIRPIFCGIGGVLLIIISYIWGPENLLPYIICLIIISILWLISIQPLKKHYQNILLESLKFQKIELNNYDINLTDKKTLIYLEKHINSNSPNKIIYALELLEDIKSESDICLYYKKLLKSSHNEVLKNILPKIEKLQNIDFFDLLIPILKNNTDNDIKNLSIRALAASGKEQAYNIIAPFIDKTETKHDTLIALFKYINESTKAKAINYIAKMSKSENFHDKLNAAKIIYEVGLIGLQKSAKLLINYQNIEIKTLMIKAYANEPLNSHLEVILPCLYEQKTKYITAQIINKFANYRQKLITEFNKTSDNIKKISLIIAMGESKSTYFLPILLNIFINDDISLKIHAIESLLLIRKNSINSKISKSKLYDILNNILYELYVIKTTMLFWNKVTNKQYFKILEASFKMRLGLIFKILYLKYNENSILKVFLNIQSFEFLSNALEYIDSRINWKNKKLFFNLFEGTKEDILSSFRTHFQKNEYDIPEILLTLNDNILNALAYYILKQSKKEIINKNFSIFDKEKQIYIKNILHKKGEQMLNTIEKIMFLKNVEIFRDLSNEYIVYIADKVKELNFLKDDIIFKEGENDRTLFVIFYGKVQISKNNNEVANLNTKECFGEMALLDGLPRSASAKALENTGCLTLDFYEFYNLLTENIDIAKGIFSILTKRLRQMLKTSNSMQEKLTSII